MMRPGGVQQGRSDLMRRGPMGGGHPGMMTVEKPKSFRKTMRTFLRYLRPYRASLIIVLVFAIASTAFSIIGPRMLGNATTILFNGIRDKALQVPGAAIDFAAIGRIALTLLGLYLASALFNYIQGYVMSGVAMKVTYNFRKDIAEKIRHMPLKYFDNQTHGEVLSRVTNDVDTINTTLTQNLSQIVTSVTMIIGTIVMMFSISWLMTIVALVVLPTSFGFVRVIIGASQKYFKKNQDYLGHVNGHVEEMYSGHIVMKAFNGEAKSIEKFDALNNTLYDVGWKSQFFSGMMFPIMNFVSNVGYVGVSVLGGYLAVRGTIAVGDILAFVQYMRTFTMPIAQTANIANVLQSTAAAAERRPIPKVDRQNQTDREG